MTSSLHPTWHRALAGPIIALSSISLLLAACGTSSNTATSGATSATTGHPNAASSRAAEASVTVKAANLPGLDAVLVNGDGRTFYVLASEQGGRITCIVSDGCTKYWSPAVLPPGMARGIAGAGVKASLFGAERSPTSDLRLTYDGWPLYTYVGDRRPGQATGQGVKDAFGVWWVLSASGTPIKSGAPAPKAPAPTSPAPKAPAPTSPAPTAPASTAPRPTAPPLTQAPATTAPSTTAPTTTTTTVPATGGGGF